MIIRVGVPEEGHAHFTVLVAVCACMGVKSAMEKRFDNRSGQARPGTDHLNWDLVFATVQQCMSGPLADFTEVGWRKLKEVVHLRQDNFIRDQPSDTPQYLRDCLSTKCLVL